MDPRSFDLMNPPRAYFDDPAPFFKALRDHDPIHLNQDGSVLLTRHEDVQAVWRDLTGTVEKQQYFRDRFGEGPLYEHFTTSMLFRDPPDHDRIRALLNPFFTRASLESLRHRIDQIVGGLIEDVSTRDEIEFIGDFAFRLPTAVICMLIGVPLTDGEHLHRLSHTMLVPLNQNATAQQIAEGHKAAGEFSAYLLRHLQSRREVAELEPSADILSALAAAERAGREITESEIVHSAMVIFNGGHNTTIHLLASSLHSLIDRPDQLELLAADPTLMESAIEEFLRYVTPVQLHWRRSTAPLNIPSGKIAEGTEILLCAAAANRDERVFQDPDTLDIRRRPNAHIAFGAGVHFCIGRALARLEMTAALTQLLSRFRSFERTGEARYLPLPKFRALERLPIRMKP